MKKQIMFQRLAASFVITAILAQFGIAAGPPKANAITRPAPLADIALQRGGVLTGQVVDAQGAAQRGAQVWVLQNEKLVSTARAGRDGRFAINGLRGGMYQIRTVHGGGVYRVWAPRTAPPIAARGVLLVNDTVTQRAQFGGGFAPVALGTALGAGSAMAGYHLADNKKIIVIQAPPGS